MPWAEILTPQHEHRMLLRWEHDSYIGPCASAVKLETVLEGGMEADDTYEQLVDHNEEYDNGYWWFFGICYCYDREWGEIKCDVCIEYLPSVTAVMPDGILIHRKYGMRHIISKYGVSDFSNQIMIDGTLPLIRAHELSTGIDFELDDDMTSEERIDYLNYCVQSNTGLDTIVPADTQYFMYNGKPVFVTEELALRVRRSESTYEGNRIYPTNSRSFSYSVRVSDVLLDGGIEVEIDDEDLDFEDDIDDIPALVPVADLFDEEGEWQIPPHEWTVITDDTPMVTEPPRNEGPPTSTVRLFVDNGEDCVVCQYAITGDQLVTQFDGCGHSLHHECALNWLLQRQSCPICSHPTTYCDKLMAESRVITADVNTRVNCVLEYYGDSHLGAEYDFDPIDQCVVVNQPTTGFHAYCIELKEIPLNLTVNIQDDIDREVVVDTQDRRLCVTTRGMCDISGYGLKVGDLVILRVNGGGVPLKAVQLWCKTQVLDLEPTCLAVPISHEEIQQGMDIVFDSPTLVRAFSCVGEMVYHQVTTTVEYTAAHVIPADVKCGQVIEITDPVTVLYVDPLEISVMADFLSETNGIAVHLPLTTSQVGALWRPNITQTEVWSIMDCVYETLRFISGRVYLPSYIHGIREIAAALQMQFVMLNYFRTPLPTHPIYVQAWGMSNLIQLGDQRGVELNLWSIHHGGDGIRVAKNSGVTTDSDMELRMVVSTASLLRAEIALNSGCRLYVKSGISRLRYLQRGGAIVGDAIGDTSPMIQDQCFYGKFKSVEYATRDIRVNNPQDAFFITLETGTVVKGYTKYYDTYHYGVGYRRDGQIILFDHLADFRTSKGSIRRTVYTDMPQRILYTITNKPVYDVDEAWSYMQNYIGANESRFCWTVVQKMCVEPVEPIACGRPYCGKALKFTERRVQRSNEPEFVNCTPVAALISTKETQQKTAEAVIAICDKSGLQYPVYRPKLEEDIKLKAITPSAVVPILVNVYEQSMKELGQSLVLNTDIGLRQGKVCCKSLTRVQYGNDVKNVAPFGVDAVLRYLRLTHRLNEWGLAYDALSTDSVAIQVLDSLAPHQCVDECENRCIEIQSILLSLKEEEDYRKVQLETIQDIYNENNTDGFQITSIWLEGHKFFNIGGRYHPRHQENTQHLVALIDAGVAYEKRDDIRPFRRKYRR